MLRLLMVTLCGTLILSCNNAKSEGQAQAKALKSGIELKNMDTSVRPQDDFYRYVNGTWLDTIEIPADKSVYSSFTEISEENRKRLRAIIEETAEKQGPAGSPTQQVGDFYKSFMNTELIEQRGTQPLAEDLAMIDKAANHDDLVNLFVHLTMIGVRIPVGSGVSVDAKDATRYVLYNNQSGLSLPDRDYYLGDNEKFVEVRTKYLDHLEKMFDLAGIENAAKNAKRVMDLETEIAKLHWERVKLRDRDKSYNKYTLEALDKEAPGFDWTAYVKGLGSTENEVIVGQPDYFQNFAKLFQKVSVDDWKVYARWQLLNTFADVLTEDLVKQNFEFYGRTLSGQQEMEPRWKQAVNYENSLLGELVGKIYVEKHFKPEAKQRMEGLVANLKATFAERLDQLDWMSPETKKEAHDKLSKFNAKIGYPNKWRDYSALEIKADDLAGNLRRANIYESKRDIGRLGNPIDKEEWFMTPQMVNAYYSSTRNEIVFPAAILQPPFFDLDADMAANYGGIGAVIGHEMTHGFDDQGRKSDGNGNLRDWWVESDRIEFEKRAGLMVDQYNGYKPLEDMAVNGELTLGENIADLGGLTMAYYAYKRSLDGKPAPEIDGYTGEQRVFLSWSQVWRRKYREEALRQRLATDTHSPGRYRAIGAVSNMPEFYEAFDVKAGDPMFRDESVRVKIW